ncbi:MAG: bifunctional demethylmenaquinone methyltransferase/2-methoxy-6-polyprenyl-1,4-benzoquinol methylase UbiE [Dongiaceae bacterium]
MSTMPAPDPNDSASFGYRDVPAGEKSVLVRQVFESVAGRYDLMNDLMSGGIHRLWKGAMIDWLRPRPGQSFIDVAGGTGDIAFRILDRLAAAGGTVGSMAVCDLTPAMLGVGRDRAIDRGMLSGLEWVAGNAESLPFADMSFDAYTIAFGLRNVARIDRALAEARRVLKPGGRFLCLEFSRVILPVLAGAYQFYSFQILPTLGQIVTGDRDSYQYLVESIRRFPAQEELSARIADAGLGQVEYRNLTGGIAALHSAWRV